MTSTLTSRLTKACAAVAFSTAVLAIGATSAHAQYQGVSREEQESLRDDFENRSFLGHFGTMDTSNDLATTMEEMDTYFTKMFYTFDRNRNGTVSVEEAPSLLLQIRLMGKPFPNSGLTLSELRFRLGETFKFLDKNNNGKLGWPEML